MSSDPVASLGAFVTASEAERLAVQFESGQHTSSALAEINRSRRENVKRLLTMAELGHRAPELTVTVLRAIVGAKSELRELTPVWTMPGNEATIGHLTSEFHRIVRGARDSITAATYNFQETSQMWAVLKTASEQPSVVVTLYVDANVADADKVKAQLPHATVYRSGELSSGKRVVSHAKFIAIDHHVLLLTSANFSYSAENRNVELGILIRDDALVRSVESTMTSKHGSLYELVQA